MASPTALGMTSFSLALFNRHADAIAPFRPRTIVITDVVQPEQISQHKPSVTGALADPAIHHGVGIWINAATLNVNFLELRRRFEGAIVLDRRFPRHTLGSWDMTSTQYTLLRILRHVRDLALVFAG